MKENGGNLTMEYKFEVTTIQAGQVRRYGDSKYIYEIVSNLPENIVKCFCINILKSNNQTKEEWENKGNYFLGYYEFEKIADNLYRYYVFEPYCD